MLHGDLASARGLHMAHGVGGPMRTQPSQPSGAAASLHAAGSSSRGYAKAAPAAASPKGGDAAGGQSVKYRRSYTRLFSCRNDRFRSAFEQIWPTLRLTEAEQQLFKRNSRLFVVETGRAISLKQKFNVSRPPPEPPAGLLDAPPRQQLKPHYAEARSALFESDLHLDAAGEHPRYLKIRKIRTQFGVRLQNTRKVSRCTQLCGAVWWGGNA
jgi:hypothetical protein